VLIELLVVVVIIALLAVYLLRGSGGVVGGGTPGTGGGATTIPGKAFEQAKGTVCKNNLGQLRSAISTYYATAGAYPPDLQSLQAGVPARCPVGGEDYTYDPTTGQVSCPHPGHTGY